MVQKKAKTIVLCIDRDNDIGEKARVQGPIIGWKKNIAAAEGLALVDPEDSDVNAIFAAVKIARKLDTEVVTLTGDANVGIISDEKIIVQLDRVIKELSPESVILVTDGAEDEQLIPIIQSRVKISSVQTMVVRQSKELEKAYFTATKFLKEISEDPNLARLLFAVPGIVLVLLAIGGRQAMTFILGIVGIYLILKGLGYEERVFNKLSEFIESLSIEKISTLTYLMSVIILIIGLGYAYSDLNRTPLDFEDMDSALDTVSMFLLNTTSINLLLLAIAIAILGRVMDDYAMKKYVEIRRYFIIIAFAGLLRVILAYGAKFWIDEGFGLGDFMLFSVISISVFIIIVKITEYLFVSEIQSIQEIIKSLSGMDVYTNDGDHLGKVSKVLIKEAQLDGIKVGRTKVERDKIVSTDKVVVVNLGK